MIANRDDYKAQKTLTRDDIGGRSSFQISNKVIGTNLPPSTSYPTVAIRTNTRACLALNLNARLLGGELLATTSANISQYWLIARASSMRQPHRQPIERKSRSLASKE
jgi:hypothetical protein